MRVRFALVFSCLGALFAAAAFLGAIPNCWSLIQSSTPAFLYSGIAAFLTFIFTKLPRRTVPFMVMLGLVALTLRLAWALSAALPPPPDDDYGYYRQVALSCLQGDWSGLISTYYPWGYFLYLYALGKLFGPSLLPPLVANAIVGSATTILVYAIARRFCEERNARLAGAIYALWPGVIYWSGVLCTEMPHLLFFLAALLCLLVGLDSKRRIGLSMAAGGVLAGISELIRPISLLLLLPFALYAGTRGNRQIESVNGSQKKADWRRTALALGSYLICLTSLLIGKSIVTGYPNFSTSQTLGANLASGLNWETRGAFSVEDGRIWYSEDPREANRRGIQVALGHLKSMWGHNRWQIPALVVLKFQRIWSVESCGYYASSQGLTDDQEKNHWLALYRKHLVAIGQFFHTFILALAALGFWRTRRSGSLALLGCILISFALLHAVIEVDDRYHFAVQSLLAIAAGAVAAKKDSHELHKLHEIEI
jgi:4-amino-4-deoxy-L-arabinose transferase-like glycosyltransferase